MVLKKQLQAEIETLKFSVRAYKGQHTKMRKLMLEQQETIQDLTKGIQLLKSTKFRNGIPKNIQMFIRKNFPKFKLF